MAATLLRPGMSVLAMVDLGALAGTPRLCVAQRLVGKVGGPGGRQYLAAETFPSGGKSKATSVAAEARTEGPVSGHGRRV